MEYTDAMKDFGKRVKRRRIALHMQQSILAEKLDISVNHLSSIENGKSKPSYDLLCRLCIVLKINPDYLMLGNIHSQNVSKNTIDKLHLCSKRDIDILNQIIEIFVSTTKRD